jgi:hypothetical protein
MAKTIIEARVKQKKDTLTNWMNNPLILLDGEQAFVVNSLGQGVNFRIGDGTKRFSDLPNWIAYDQAAYVAPVGNTLPTPSNGVGYSLLIPGTYNSNLVVPPNNLGKAEYIGNNWVLTNMQLPTNNTTAISYTNTSLSTGRFWDVAGIAIGGTMPENSSIFGDGTTQQFNTLKVRIYQGDSLTLRTQGGSNSRAYYITDINRKVIALSPASANYLTTPFTYTSQIDGWLYITATQTGYNSFSLVINRLNNAEITYRVGVLEQKIDGDQPSPVFNPPIFKNNPQPISGESLRVLFMSNSYAVDTNRDINRFIDAAGIDQSKIGVFVAFQSGGSLNDWWNNLQNNASFTLERRGGTLSIGSESGTINGLLSKNWDIIVLQQASLYSTDYNTYSNLPNIINHIRRYCTNQRLCFGWNSIWSYANGYSTTPTGLERLNLTLECTKKVVNEIGIDVVIPTGVAIQNARLVTSPVIDGGYGLTRDGTHLAFGTGTYIAAATFFHTVISPFFNVPLIGSSARRAATAGTGDNAYAYPVDESNYMVCQMAAFKAVQDRWNVNNPSQ